MDKLFFKIHRSLIFFEFNWLNFKDKCQCEEYFIFVSKKLRYVTCNRRKRSREIYNGW
jgi:hypothetical protein